jgi:hypothetical protein
MLTQTQLEWLNTCNVTDSWHLNPEGLVNVMGYIILPKTSTHIPVRFGHVTGNFYCHDTNITSLAGAPRSVGGNFYCNKTKITSLAGAPKSVGRSFYCHDTPLVNHLLAFFRAPGIKSVNTGDEAADAILCKHLGSADRDMLLCQDELIDAGFGGQARL